MSDKKIERKPTLDEQIADARALYEERGFDKQGETPSEGDPRDRCDYDHPTI